MFNLSDAKKLLESESTCVLFKGDEVIESKERGIKPIMWLIAENKNLKGFHLADKIIGKAVALLAVYAGITNAFAEVMSKSAVEVLKKHNIDYSYKTLTDKIINREGTGICPMEETVQNIDDAATAYAALKTKLESLSKK